MVPGREALLDLFRAVWLLADVFQAVGEEFEGLLRHLGRVEQRRAFRTSRGGVRRDRGRMERWVQPERPDDGAFDRALGDGRLPLAPGNRKIYLRAVPVLDQSRHGLRGLIEKSRAPHPFQGAVDEG